MGKIDDMRRIREQSFADMEKRGAKAPPAVRNEPAANADPPAPAPARNAKAGAGADATEGKCAECGKTKPVQNGVMAQHQKGFGKVCAGSRKAPA